MQRGGYGLFKCSHRRAGRNIWPGGVAMQPPKEADRCAHVS